MQKKICFTLDTDKDKGVLAVLDRIPQCMRGSFIKIAIVMDIDEIKDKEILQKYPDFLNNPMRYEIIKSLLKQTGGKIEQHVSPTPNNPDGTDDKKWISPVFELPMK